MFPSLLAHSGPMLQTEGLHDMAERSCGEERGKTLTRCALRPAFAISRVHPVPSSCECSTAGRGVIFLAPSFCAALL